MNPLAGFFSDDPERRAAALHTPARTMIVDADSGGTSVLRVTDQVDILTGEDDDPRVEGRHEEWHVTVEGDPIAWGAFCREYGFKPLFIELSNHTTQLMCEASVDPRAIIASVITEDEQPLFKVVRTKHEVSKLREGETALYYEAHVKFHGPWRLDRKGVSRDLFRVHSQRWYMTQRSLEPFSGGAFAVKAQLLARPSTFVEYEYEACILDTNLNLDTGWV